MSVGVIVELVFKPEGVDSFVQTMKDRLPFTRAYDGCEDIHLYVYHDNPNRLLLVERWASREHYDKYREWAMAQPGTQEAILWLEREMTTYYLDETGA
jgi:quinol monooxygenase YgiN